MHRVSPYVVTDPQILKNGEKIRNAFENNLLVCDSVPDVAVIDIGNVCNQLCRFCPALKLNDNKKKVLLSEEDFEGFTWLRNVKQICLSGFFGDVLANKNFPQILRKVRSLAPYSDLKVYTNGIGLTEENIDVILECCSWLHLSVNAITPDVYRKSISGGRYDRHIKNMLSLAEKKIKQRKHLYVSTSFVVTRISAPDVEKFVQFVCNMPFERINLHYGYYLYSPFEKKSNRFFGKEEFLEHYDCFDPEALNNYCKAKGVTFFARTHEACYAKEYCIRPWNNIFLGIVNSKPGMYLCCPGTRPLLETPNFNNFRNIEKFWNHERIQEIRRNVNNSQPTNDMCVFCRTPKKIVTTMPDIARILMSYKQIAYDGEFKFYSPINVN